jgi:Xaa-Pro aminopeptidase
MSPREFAKRRKQLMKMMGEGAIAILPSAPVRIRNRDVDYAYRQDSDFLYVTGFEEPESVAALIPGRGHGEYILFCRDKDPIRETWDGRRAGPEGAVNDHAADDAFPVGDIDDILPGMLEQCERVYYTMGVHPEFDKRLMGWVNALRAQVGKGKHTPHEFIVLDHVLHDMRLYKSRAEMTAMKRSARIAADAHVRAMKVCRPGMREYEIEAEFLHEFRRRGTEPSYHPIVGAGENSCILHYTENDNVINDGDLLLIDAGCEYEGYASDITRTFPVNGRFTAPQRAIYELVLAAQEAAIDQIAPGKHCKESHEAAVRVITRGLVKLGILKGKVPALIKSEAYKRFFMHGTGHWLGLDVHDVGDYKVGDEWRLLEPGMVMTVEPGLYIPSGSKGVAKKWWGIGVRIEDDVLVTKQGNEVLTRHVPKEPGEIEQLMEAA